MDIAAHSIDTLNPGDLSNVAATVDNLALTIRDGWGEEADAASDALKRAAYLLGVADWTDKVRRVLAEVEPSGERLYESRYRPEYLYIGEWTLDPGEFCFTRWSPSGLSRDAGYDYTNLSIRVLDADDRFKVITALMSNGLVDGWSGDDVQFEEAHSRFGWISVKVGSTKHPAA
jgi:hypothetical protein